MNFIMEFLSRKLSARETEMLDFFDRCGECLVITGIFMNFKIPRGKDAIFSN